MKKTIVLLLACNLILAARSQNVGVGTAVPDPSAQLDISGTGRGLLIPRMGSSFITAIPNPAKGLMVYD